MPQTRAQALSEAELTILTDKLIAKENQLKQQQIAFQEIMEQEREGLRNQEAERCEELNKIIRELRNKVTDLESRATPEATRTPAFSLEQEILSLRAEIRNIRESSIHNTNQGSSGNFETAFQLRDVLDMIPTFDGHNMPVIKFSRVCKRAREMIPPHMELQLVRAIRAKITGRAYVAIEDETHSTISGLIETLRNKFAPLKSPHYYKGKLADIFKAPQEHILDYISRVKDLKSAVIDSEKSEGKPVDPELESFTLKCFIDGLPTDHRILLKLEGYTDLTDAFNKAILVANSLNTDKDRARMKPLSSAPPPHHSVTSNPKQSNFVNTSRLTQPTVCPICNKFGHTERECFRNPLNQPHGSRGSPPNKFCNICKRNNHNTSECRAQTQRQGNTQTLPLTGAQRDNRATARPVHTVEMKEPETPASTISN